MPELWELRDEQERPTGKYMYRGERIPEGYWHIVVTIWTLTADGRILLTRRHPDKHFALLWEGTAGSVQAGESSLEGALRELREETGLRAEPGQLRLLSSERGESVFLDTYLYVCPEKEPALTLQPEEVVEARFVPLGEMDAWLEKMAPPAVARFRHDREKLEAAAAGYGERSSAG
jgi:8-oxo-dGTP pyrophosphatase MutT (NUDIX family)